MTLTLHRWEGYLILDGRARLDDLPIICLYAFGDMTRMNVLSRFPADLVALNMKSAFIFAVN